MLQVAATIKLISMTSVLATLCASAKQRSHQVLFYSMDKIIIRAALVVFCCVAGSVQVTNSVSL